MTINYAYNDFGLLTNVTYGNPDGSGPDGGASVTYQYDVVRRLTQIAQKDASGGTLLQMDYTYTADDLPLTITESGALSGSATVTYTYDNRRRLSHEVRTGATPYNLAYEYDAGGNRTIKIDALAHQQTEYHYDVDAGADPGNFNSKDNRLESYEVYDITGGAHTLLSTTWYYYHYGDDGKSSGNVERIVTKQASGPEPNTLTATRFGYARNGRAVVYVLGETWTYGATCPTGYAINYAREFRYDGARARYLNRSLDVSSNGLMHSPPVYTALSSTWSDYNDDDIYADFTVSGTVATTTVQYDPSRWNNEGGAANYIHDDHLGTLRLTTDASGEAGASRVFTAFGERIVGPNDRFGYVAAFGYQSHSQFPFLHLGARYYDPAAGRFLQRDPSGIVGDLNVYEYAWSSPSGYFDPDGFQAQPSGTAGAATNPRVVKEVAGAVKDVEEALGAGAKAAAKQGANRPKAGVLRRLWERLTGKKWPKDPKTGKPQDVHHTKPRADGGRDTVDNIEPKPHDKHISDHSENGDFSRWARRRGNMNCGP